MKASGASPTCDPWRIGCGCRRARRWRGLFFFANPAQRADSENVASRDMATTDGLESREGARRGPVTDFCGSSTRGRRLRFSFFFGFPNAHHCLPAFRSRATRQTRLVHSHAPSFASSSISSVSEASFCSAWSIRRCAFSRSPLAELASTIFFLKRAIRDLSLAISRALSPAWLPRKLSHHASVSACGLLGSALRRAAPLARAPSPPPSAPLHLEPRPAPPSRAADRAAPLPHLHILLREAIALLRLRALQRADLLPHDVLVERHLEAVELPPRCTARSRAHRGR